MPEILDDLKEEKKSRLKSSILWALLMIGNGLLLGLTMHKSTPIYYYFLYGIISPIMFFSILGTIAFTLDLIILFFMKSSTEGFFSNIIFKGTIIDAMFLFSIIGFLILLILYLLGFNFDFALNN